MLAAPKFKKKYAPNPQNKNWQSHSTDFASKLMSKMGWEQGKGLGSNLSGRSDILKVEVKNDSRGLGFDPSVDSKLSVHMDSFNAILSSLSSVAPKAAKVSEVNNSSQDFQKLDETKRSKLCKRRLQNKNLSNKNINDIKTILGQNLPVKQDTVKTDTPHLLHLYGKDKSSRISDDAEKRALDIIDRATNGSTREEMKSREQEVVQFEDDNEGDEQKQMKKKKKKRKQVVEDNKCVLESLTTEQPTTEQPDVSEPLKKKKKKRKDKAIDAEGSAENPAAEAGDKEVCTDYGITTYINTISTQDYFKQKMAEKMKALRSKSNSTEGVQDS